MVIGMVASSTPAFAQKITVKSATPNNGAQGSVSLDIVIDGSGFGSDSVAQFHVSGTTNPGGIRVNSTRRVSNSQIVANIDIDDLALLSYYDIKVVSNGRTGKGTDLFQVVTKQQACTGPLLVMPLVVDVPLPGAGPACQPSLSGTLDCTFGSSGRVVLSDIFNGTAWGVAHQADGRLMVLARGSWGVYLLRLTAGGALDTTFATGGIRHLDYLTYKSVNASALVVQSDGKVVVGATAYTGKGSQSLALVTRLLSNGAIDATFGIGGVVAFSYESATKPSILMGMALQSDGRIVVAGGNGVARLMPNGAFDPSFDLDGRLVVPARSREEDLKFSAVRLLDSGSAPRVLLTGSNTSCDGGGQMAIVTLLGNGAPDTSFGPHGDGRVQLRLFNYANNASGASLDALGRIVVTGWASSNIGGTVTSRATAVRLLSDGQADVSFGNDGAVAVGIEGWQTVSETPPALDATGRLILGGWTQTRSGVTPSDGRFFMTRLLDGGQIDPTFGSGGVAVTDLSSGQDFATALALDASGRIVQVGKNSTPSLLGLIRYVP
jgi:uncharacterized delta-60 repeat protein